MALDELYKVVDRESRDRRDVSLIAIILAVLLLAGNLSSFLYNYVVWGLFPWVLFEPYIVLLYFLCLQSVYICIRHYRFASKVRQSLKRGAVSGALSLLDFYDEVYKLSRNILLLDFVAVLAVVVYRLYGLSQSWWLWTEFQFAANLFLIIVLAAVCIVYIPFTSKWKKRNKVRKKIQEMMEEYMRQQ